MLLPSSWGLLLWDSMIRWLAVAFFIQIPIDIAYNMQERIPHWYYITIQVRCKLGAAALPSSCIPAAAGWGQFCPPSMQPCLCCCHFCKLLTQSNSTLL